jgi:hypothetical protein
MQHFIGPRLGWMAAAALALAAASACGDDSDASDPDAGGDDDDGLADAGGTTIDAGADDADGSPDAGDGRPSGTLPVCLPTCRAPADCEIVPGAFDADNYTCDDGACVWRGCNSSAECEESFGPDQACADVLGGLATCVTSCSVAADCPPVFPTDALHDEDNYECVDGACKWAGCQDSAECQEVYERDDYACATYPGTDIVIGIDVDYCYQTCETAADCAVEPPLDDVDNFACTEGLCIHLGCNSTEECVEAAMSDEYVCAE